MNLPCPGSEKLIIESTEMNYKPKISKSPFGRLTDNRAVSLYTMENQHGMKVLITDFGSTITSILVPDKSKELRDVVLGYESLDEYVNDQYYMGAIIGRYANRIAGGEVSMNGNSYQLTLNDPPNHLHGGDNGFNKVLWESHIQNNNENQRLVMEYNSPDGEEGYPGNLQVSIQYDLTDQNELLISMEAVTDSSTFVNLTAHPYFNLNGAGSGTAESHLLNINARKFLPLDINHLPTGVLEPVENTPMDFLNIRAIGDKIGEANEQLTHVNGYDHTWVIDNWDSTLREASLLVGDESGIRMRIQTTLPGVHLYTGNFLASPLTGKENKAYDFRSGICLEPQFFPNSPNLPQFPSTILSSGEIYRHQIRYQFDNDLLKTEL